MKKLLVYMKEYKKESILGPLFKLLEATFELLVPLVMASVIDVGIHNRDQNYIIRMCLLLVGLGVVGLICSITAQYFAAKASVGFAANLRRALFSHIQSLSFTEMDRVGGATLITRMTSDVNQVQNGVNLTLRLLLRSPFVVFGAMVMAFTVDWKAALVFAAVIPLLAAVVFGIMLWTMPRYKKVQAGLDRVLGITRENLTGVRVVRAFGREEAETRRFQESNRELTNLQVFVGRISSLMNPLTFVLINVAAAVLIWVGAVRVDAGFLTQGAVVALLNYMSQILVELIKMANLIINISKALACANRISNVLETESTLASPVSPKASGEERGTVVFENVSLTYAGAGAPSLTNLSFRAGPGETIGIIGGTGSGKSTVVNLIPRFYDVTEGRVLVDGVDVREYDVNVLRGKIGAVMQKAVLFTGTIRENLLWGREDAGEEELWQALETAQAREFVEQKPGKLEEAVSQGGKNLSGGQKQRLTIARALVRRPEILILDDSASALDFATDAKLRKAIREMPGAPTVFLVSQRASSLQYADQIIVLDDGEAVGIGTHSELLESCEVYREIYESQFQKAGKEAAV
ncbi:ABC transporter ATP-binding protein [Neglectibacter timonensis]|uniref:ABC transporter ATP-binding protein n=1 Tax=Neglectibacter timonensis TaxID=1776382 RepID=UPI000834A559|nr:ABC transporter ATP-binding protein [Neglectibacter timonensis]MCQ4843583.1 ABC transporter ATP-binding protein/permease [Neglectibacter timonensis]MEE0731438.1 ABC transporter ATP-binding protein [Oscillospiraceae bacterium]